MLKNARPDLVVMQFWHIPWPNREVFRVCPWQDEILDGLLGNDLLSFHIQYHCNNFLDTVDRAIEARVDTERFAVTRGGHDDARPAPPDQHRPGRCRRRSAADDLEQEETRLRKQLRLQRPPLLVGVDRVDYTKGIPERFRAVDRLLTLHPELKGRFCFVQVGAPSRTHIPAYRQLNEELEALAEEINWRHGDDGWRPIVFLNEHYEPEQVYALYRMATACVVSSLHDGMNLVAKEFVAARTDLRGRAGAVEVHRGGAGADRRPAHQPLRGRRVRRGAASALTMPAEEQERRMRRMRAQVADNNIYRWAGMLLSEAGKLAEVVHGSGCGR